VGPRWIHTDCLSLSYDPSRLIYLVLIGHLPYSGRGKLPQILKAYSTARSRTTINVFFASFSRSNMAPDETKTKKRSISRAAIANSSRATKRAKIVDARTILTESSDKALNNRGELDVGAFVKAREFEIRALEDGMANSKKMAATRAFQQVPRELRRRTASHNVKRVPRRLRARAAKEVCLAE
jgi:hypothetical protein